MQGHAVRVRTEDGLVGAPIPVGVGVLQGDTLAPFLFVLVLDAVLRTLPRKGMQLSPLFQPILTARQRTLYMMPTQHLLPGTAYADDICLLAHSCADLQDLYRALERSALLLGLKINYGAGKTERFVCNDAPGLVTALSGQAVPVVSTYKYLGVYIFSFDQDLRHRKTKAWAALSSMREIWRSNASTPVKRALFRSLVEPILGYGLLGWPLHASQAQRVDAAYSRMLRYALGLPPAIISRARAPTEVIYGTGTPTEIPFLSAEVRARRISLLGHMMRQQAEGRAHHYALQLLEWNPGLRHKPKRGRRATMVTELCSDMHTLTVTDALHTLLDRGVARRARARVLDRAQTDAWTRVRARRLRAKTMVTPHLV
jgi:hypothetical protein